jgi:hypothetical protein
MPICDNCKKCRHDGFICDECENGSEYEEWELEEWIM